MTTFEPSLSASMRASSHDAPSMADQLPSINFGFEELRSRMNQFTARFDDFIEKGRRRVLEERNQFRVNVAEIQEDQRMKKRDIEILSLKQTQHSQNLAKESAETSEMHAAITTLTTQRDERMTHRDALRAQIAEMQKSISTRREAQLKHRRYLDGQSRYNEPELEFWESYLGLRIEGLGKEDSLKFVYTNVCEREWEREAWFELDTSEREYRIGEVRPKVEREETDRVLERLNETRDLAAFLKGMRELFVEALK
ncbi:kinetochore-associated Ndc80 complex subunit spc25 [Didymosphaeria variabile]|uniref:Kinetochore protein SPC25 n=1 Tax=Didymosphaeria variabile TaxID=1932322 RepID=A0A9W8XIU9_9PLEO|nr:kinetochore-associated Ndc80 complex subunit spc25 [Didymosphaeria variabile]KAJ4351779.1 kinetochore-associated Ndc80 complex subunit spc25 [Didymosphaeria variabile]